nr:SpaA isopeptide-forming pilin-related protein [uncultured Mediterraneibacter sp.]
MQNKGTDYIRRLLKDKTRLKRWRKMILCLSCVVVFCTVYALILPAITLERKTVCGQEEHSHTEECYSSDGQLTCGKTEHTHTESCYADDKTSEDQSGENSQQTPEQSQTEGQEQNQGQSQEQNQNQSQDQSQSQNQVQTSDDGNVAQNGENGDTAGTTADETAGNDEESVVAGSTPAPVAEGEGGTGSATTATAGFDLSANLSKVESVSMSYQEKDGNWVDIPTGRENEIPGNVKIRVQVQYKDIPIDQLIGNHNCAITYPIPIQLRNVATGDIVDESNKVVGHINVQNGKIVVTFKKEYLEELNKSPGTSTIAGNFHVEGKIDLNQLDNQGKTTLTTADKQYQLNFGPDALAKYAEISVKKECNTTKVVTIGDEDYLKYTITVTANEDRCPSVSIVDKFVTNSQCVACYVGITETKTTLSSSKNGQNPVETKAEGKNAGSIYLGNTAVDNTKPGVLSGTTIETPPGSMVWEIGDMEPHETRTLTYYVKLKKNVPLNNKKIENNAQIFCKEQPRDSKGDSFTPTLNYDTQNMKALGESGVVRNDNGTYTISYKLNFDLYKNGSNYPLRNFEFLDYLDHYMNSTNPTVRRYVTYNNDVKLYKVEADGNNQVNDSAYQVKWSTDGSAYDKFDNINNPTSFKVSGTTENPLTINPGEHYYVTYSVTVKPEALAAMKKDNVEIKNRMIVAASNADKSKGTGFEAYGHNETIGNYKWDEKTVSPATNANQTFTMNDDIYDLTLGEGIKKDTSGSKSFEVPAGSYLYTVDVNQTKGDWDATEVTMKDTLKSDKMQYVGYAKVEAYEYNSITDKYETLAGTKWVKIDGLNSFKLTPSQLGWEDNRYAYKFTYYAKPVNQNTFSSAKVQNSFEISGNVKNGTSTIDISTIESQKEITISGSFSMNVRKTSWYYEKPEIDAQTWKNGKLYWVIEVDGTAILKDTSFRDWISKDSGLQDSYLHKDSLVGIYKGKLPEGKQITEYNSVEELKAKEKLEDVTTTWFSEKKLTNEKNFPGDGNYSELTVTAKETHQLEGNKLYFIVRTEPQSLPINDRDTYKYKNHVSTQDKGEALVEQDSAEKELYKAPNILKELGQTFTYDKITKKITQTLEGTDKKDTSKIITDQLDQTTGSGQYASWAIKLNYAGEMSGKYRVLETIPAGMELSYIRIKWIASGTITSNRISNLNGWTEKTVTAATDSSSNQITTYYYVNENQALIELGDFVAGKQRDQNAVDVQVVCRVTDPDVLLKGDAKEFVNRVDLQTTEGKTIDVATSPATITPKKLEKKYVSNNQKINFTVKANQLGETLPTVEGGSKLKLIDKLSDTLILDPKTIQVVNSNTNSVVTFKASLKDDNTLEIEIPCDIPVTITYTATVNAPPDKKVSFSNVVYWERYTPSNGTKVEEGEYSYSAGGTVSGETNMKLIISKVDQNNTSVLLPGATFQVVNCVRDGNGDIKEVEDGSGKRKVGIGTTGDDGTVTFGRDESSNDPLMDFNTIYKVTETDAPDGYVVNSEPIYIMVPRKEGTPAAYSSYVQECINDKRIRKLYDAIYNLTVTNHKGEITVEKKFKNPGGHDSNPVSGTYRFGLYENQEATGAQIQKIQITYSAGETDTKKNKFVDLELGKTYYVFELDDEGRPIKDSSTVAIVNGMEYFTSYTTTKAGATESNSATNGDMVTVTNQNRVNKLPSTGSCGVLIYRLAGAILILFAGVLMLMKYKETKTRN